MSYTSSNNAELELRLRLKNDLPFLAEKALKIRTKEGSLAPFRFNAAQQYLHGRVEKQLEDTGKVRAIIVKGRQQGCSTYVGGRYYGKTIHRTGFRTFILAHETDATSNLFEMVQRFHEHNLDKLKPYTAKSNAKELVFSKLDSGYRVSTAGTRGTGRSGTTQLFHGSEVAFWPHAKEHAAGIGQTVPNAPDTEIFLESTGNGMGNYFHRQWVKAVAGQSEYIYVFIPWFWQTEYQLPVPENFRLSPEDQEYRELYNLSLEQMAWRASKIADLEDQALFKQEYPATADEAFQVTGVDSFIKPESVLKARKQPETKPFGAVIAGFDPSRDGEDRDSLIYRQGLNAFGLQYKNFKTFPEKLAFCETVLRSHSPYVDRLNIDYGGGGYELYGMLVEKGLGDRVRVVNFGGKPSRPEVYYNKRAEMYGELRAWLTDPDTMASIPDDDALQADLTAAGYEYDSLTRYKLESKKEIKKRGLASPDGGDALALTFAEPVFIRKQVMGGGSDKVKTDYDIFGG